MAQQQSMPGTPWKALPLGNEILRFAQDDKAAKADALQKHAGPEARRYMGATKARAALC